MFCSWRARQAGDQLLGTATQASTWLLIEHPEAWGRDAVAESGLPAALLDAINRWTDVHDGLRVQLIRRGVNSREAEEGTTVYLAHADPTSPRLDWGRWETIEALCEIDLIGAMKNEAGTETATSGFERVDEEIVLTCTNGNRDRCCARYGNALHDAFRAADATAAWQTSHLGGHRFAPTCVVLPCGAQYGWLSEDEAETLWEAHRQGRLHRLDRYRGHVGFPRPVQAADAFLRQLLDCRDLQAVSLETVKQTSTGWRVRFEVGDDDHEIKLDQTEGEAIPLSCGADPEPRWHFRLEGHRTL